MTLFRPPPRPQARGGRNTDGDENMAVAKNPDYHILPPSFGPLFGAFSALAMAAGGIMWMHGGHLSPDKANGGGWIFFLGLAGVLLTMRLWWGDVIKEAHHGDHTPVVQQIGRA